MRARLAVAMVVMAAFSRAGLADEGESLREAARLGDLARVRTLLDAGTRADNEGRHGVTALMQAAGGGHLEVARLLIERGANVNARERFFSSSVLATAARSKKPELVRLLLEKGATDADQALWYAIEQGDLDIARRALASGHLEPLDLAAARKEVAAPDSKASAEVKALLAAATVTRPARTPFTPDPKRLAQYVGRYAGGSGPEATVAVRESGLLVNVSGQPALTLAAIGPDLFENAAGDVAVAFFGRAGTIEAMIVNRNGDVTRLPVASAPPQALPKADALPTETVVRTAARAWPAFRGESAEGSGDGQGAPLTWNLAAGRNVRFKTPVPGIALSSPIVWGDRIFVTTAVSSAGDATFRTGLYGDGDSVDDVSEHAYRLLALDTKTGAIVWDREVHADEAHRQAPPQVEPGQRHAGHRRPARGRRSSARWACWPPSTSTGQELWRRDVGVLEANDPQAGTAQWGHASSPILYKDLVIVQADRVKDSFLAAYPRQDGRARVAGGARRALDVVHAHRGARGLWRRAGHQRPDGPRVRSADRRAAVDAGPELGGGGGHAGGRRGHGAGDRRLPARPSGVRRAAGTSRRHQPARGPALERGRGLEPRAGRHLHPDPARSTGASSTP